MQSVMTTVFHRTRSICICAALAILASMQIGFGQSHAGNITNRVDFITYEQMLKKERALAGDTRINKQTERQLHFLRDHLDSEGRIFNHIAANMEVVEQLYIDTLGPPITGDWMGLGPTFIEEGQVSGDGNGRVSSIAFATSLRCYVGTAGGGLWKTETAGIQVGPESPWVPLTDNIPALSVSGIVVLPGDPDTLFILTGDGNGMTPSSGNLLSTSYSVGVAPSIGILKSADGGASWDTTSVRFAQNCRAWKARKMNPDASIK
jgi:hypothetical protein